MPRAAEGRSAPDPEHVRRAVAADVVLRGVYGDVPVGSAPLGNKRDPLDELVFIQLSVRTPEREYDNTYRALWRLVGGQWAALLTGDEDAAVDAVRRGGMAQVKVRRLVNAFLSLRNLFGDVTLDPLRGMSDAQAEAALLALPGVGYKVARCVLLYSLDREVFPVDTHCFRLLGRLGMTKPGRTYRQSHNDLQALVPAPIRRSLHVNLIRHGRTICIPRQPRCTECALLPLCPAGQRRVRDAPELEAMNRPGFAERSDP